VNLQEFANYEQVKKTNKQTNNCKIYKETTLLSKKKKKKKKNTVEETAARKAAERFSAKLQENNAERIDVLL
jgi:hypothetical protein